MAGRSHPRPQNPPAREPVAAPPFLNRTRVFLVVALLLALHATSAVHSLIQENPTVDEVIHLPAGITYWQTGSFRLYHHNPPLVKLVAALPVLGLKPVMDYRRQSWRQEPPNKAAFAHEFMADNARQYFELFTRARLFMPLFSLVGGLVVFAWSRRLYGDLGGLLSLALWAFCPNVLAHTRLVTTDMGATSLGVLATFVFWRHLTRGPSWRLAALAGICLGLAQLTKFSMVVLYGLWPLLAIVKVAADADFRRWSVRVAGHGLLMVAISVLVVDLGYAFEGVGVPLGRYEFVCQTLTKPATPGIRRPFNPDPLRNAVLRFRVNRFRDGLFRNLPVPLPEHYVLGFDDQKLEAEGVPRKLFPPYPGGAAGEQVQGYPVYLDGETSEKSWWYYYLLALAYKVPEGTWLLVLGSFAVLAASRRSRASGFDEFAVLAVPAFVLFVMSVFTNINLGLRYVLPIFPYVYVSAGKLAPWASGLRWGRVVAWSAIGLGLTMTAASAAMIHPHYLAYFNGVSGGPGRGAAHLVDSNLDWGQDLIGLRRWLSKNAPGERVGLAYFGQINPEIFADRGERFDWFLPPPRPGKMDPLPPRYRDGTDFAQLEPGLYAVSATLVEGLPWRVYDKPLPGADVASARVPHPAGFHAFSYFRRLTPIDKVGYSIWIYRVRPRDWKTSDLWDAGHDPR